MSARGSSLRRAWLCLMVGGAVSTTSASAQREAMLPVGFRTGFTQGTGPARLGGADVDFGVSMLRSGEVTSVRAGEVTAHIPVAERVELRAHLNSYAWADAPAGSWSGREDIGFGGLGVLLMNRGMRPATALVVRVETPTGSLQNRERTWRPDVRLSLGWRLPAGLMLHGNLGYARPSLRGEAYARLLASLWLAGRIAGPLGGYAELYGLSREAPAGPSSRYLHGAVTYRLASSLHLDLHAGTRLTGRERPRWIGLGLRQRW